MEGQKHILTEKEINKVLRDINFVVMHLSKNVNYDLRDDFAQELRIRIWIGIKDTEFCGPSGAESYVQENLWLFNRQALQVLYKQCRKMNKHLRYKNRPYHCYVNDIELAQDPHEPSIIEFVVSKMKGKDAEIAMLLVETGGKDIYNESTCASFGYTSRAGFHKKIQQIRQNMLEICAEYGLFTDERRCTE